MGALDADVSTWVWLVPAAVVVAVGVAARYRALIRRGSGLPPGTGGVRLVGMTGTITRNDGGGDVRVNVLGDEWRVAGETHGLAVGDHVRVTDVEGVALAVAPVPAADPDAADADPTPSQTQDGAT